MRAVPCAPFRKFKEVLENPSKSGHALSAAGHKPCQLNLLHLIDYQERSQESDGAADLQSGSSLSNTHKRIWSFPPPPLSTFPLLAITGFSLSVF